jgi:hypothetical protein
MLTLLAAAAAAAAVPSSHLLKHDDLPAGIHLVALSDRCCHNLLGGQPHIRNVVHRLQELLACRGETAAVNASISCYPMTKAQTSARSVMCAASQLWLHQLIVMVQGQHTAKS